MSESLSSESMVRAPFYKRPESWMIGLVALLGAALYGPADDNLVTADAVTNDAMKVLPGVVGGLTFSIPGFKNSFRCVGFETQEPMQQLFSCLLVHQI